MRLWNGLYTALAQNGQNDRAYIAPLAAQSQARIPLVSLPFSAAVLTALLTAVAPAMSQPFDPIRELTTWYTDPTLVDIEIVASAPRAMDVQRTPTFVRFRLQRAYVQTLLASEQRDPTIVSFALDLESGLPQSHLLAVASGHTAPEPIAGVPRLSPSEIRQRSVYIEISSRELSHKLLRRSEILASCRGALVATDRWAYEWNQASNCDPPFFPRGLREIISHGGLLLTIDCRGENFFGAGCITQIPFGGFAVEVRFNQAQLGKWPEILGRVSGFLKTKQHP